MSTRNSRANHRGRFPEVLYISYPASWSRFICRNQADQGCSSATRHLRCRYPFQTILGRIANEPWSHPLSKQRLSKAESNPMHEKRPRTATALGLLMRGLEPLPFPDPFDPF